MPKPFAEKLINWYKNHMRELPWRETNDPYKVWLSEIILQQTRVKQGLPYYQKFIKQFPTVHDLAQAPLDQVLRLWQGLGYYSRARNLHICAQMVVSDFDGKFPDTYEDLQKLKGVGKYTAAAIASFAFQKNVPVVDGNVFRVLSRVLLLDYDIANAKNFKYFFEASQELMPTKEGDLYNQAMMELGATLCTPAKPACLICPVESICSAKAEGKQGQLPVKIKHLKVRKRYFYYLVIETSKGLIMGARGPKDIWQGLYDFPLLEKTMVLKEEELLQVIMEDFPIKQNFSVEDISEPIKHVLTHQKIEAQFIHLKCEDSNDLPIENYKFYTFEEIEELPKPVLVDNYLKENFY